MRASQGLLLAVVVLLLALAALLTHPATPATTCETAGPVDVMGNQIVPQTTQCVPI